MTIQKALRSVIFVLIGVALGTFWQQTQKNSDTTASTKLSAIVAPGFNPKFSLINHDGKPVTEKDYNDKHQLIYFGFTFCPEICPTELQKIAGTLELLGDTASKIHPIFVSVDPTRDTPEVMKQYLSNFGKDFIGLTGTEETVDNAMTSFKVYAQKENDPAYADYMMAHSSYIYFLAPNGDLLGLYKKDDTSETIADGINNHLK